MSHYLTNFPIVEGVRIIDLGYNTPREYTYEETNNRIDAVANGLERLNLPANSTIGIIGTCSYNFVTTNVGIYRSRHCVVAVNYKIPAEQIEYCLRDANVKLVFCDPQFMHLVPSDIMCIEFESDNFEQFLDKRPYSCPPLDPTAMIHIMYTSGTTGIPKGVVSTYEARMWQQSKGGVEKPVIRYESSVCVCPAPLYHLAGLNNVEHDLFCSFYKNTCIVLMPQFDTKKYIEAISKYRVTHIKLIAPMMSMVLQEKELLDSMDFSSVTNVVLTSSAAPKKMQDDLKLIFKNVHDISNPYGLTETGPIFGPHPLKIPKPAASVGYPLDGVKVRLDENGVLQIKGPSMLAMYHNKNDLYNNSITEDGYFITGDIFTVNKYGFYFFQGRSDDMFKSGGEKIYPIEIESVINQHPAVAVSTVVGVEDDIKGHKPYAFVQLQPGASATATEIKEFVINNVATYQIPRSVWILDDFPKTLMGKIDRKELTSMARTLVKSNNDI